MSALPPLGSSLNNHSAVVTIETNMLIGGIDEVGRGPLAGPVTAVSVVISEKSNLPELSDSKILAPKKRESLARLLWFKTVCVGIGWAWPEEIDRLNIHHATLLAMRRSFFSLTIIPDRMLVDGKFEPHLPIPSDCIIRGDSSVPCIQAASIIAKVVRDRWMVRYSWIEPQYCFSLHKGYPTILHRKLISVHGPSFIHRYSFRSSE
jgi:ribonuclease HII